MAEVASSLKAYCDRVPEENQWKLDEQIDFEHGGIQTHLGAIADVMDEWEGRVAEALRLNKATISGIKVKHPDDLALQTREALCCWQEVNGLEATYRNLIRVFLKAGKSSFAEAVCKVLGVKQGLLPGQGEKEKKVLQANEAKIRKSFGHLKREILHILKGKKIEMDEFVAFAKSLFPAEVVECIPAETEKISTIFDAITNNALWSYSHYTPLTSIAEEFAEDDTQELIESYETKLASFYATTKLTDFIAQCKDVESTDVAPTLNPAKYDGEFFHKLTIKIGRRVTNETLQYIADIWKVVAKFFALPSLTALLDAVVAGSLVICWYIPHHFAMQIRLNSTGDEATAFFQAHQIIEVKIDEDYVYKSETRDVNKAAKLALIKACKEGNLDQVLKLIETLSDFDFSQYDDTPLTAAARNSHFDVLQVLLLYPFDINGADKDGGTALMFASYHGKTEIMDLLIIYHNADVNARLKNGGTALMWACQVGRADVVELLIKHNADVNIKADNGVTALMTAGLQGNTNIMELLLKHNADVDARSKNGGTALITASIQGKTDVVEILIKYNADVNATDANGTTALMLASQEGITGIVELLVKHNADVNTTAKNGMTALMAASLRGRVDVVELLIEHNADVNAWMEDGKTALIAASQEGQTDVVEILIKHNADVNAGKGNGMTALMVASYVGKPKVMELLIKHQADVNATMENGATALMIACYRGETESVKILLKHNVNVNAQMENGMTALMVASQEGKTDVVDLLIKHNADVNAKDQDGLTALAIATQKGKVKTVSSLLEAGADCGIAENETNWTPLFFASKDGHMEIVQLLIEHGADLDFKDKNGVAASDTALAYNQTDVSDLLLAISMSRESSEEASTDPAPPNPEETRKHVLNAANYVQKLFDKQKRTFMKITDFLLPERASKRRVEDNQAASERRMIVEPCS